MLTGWLPSSLSSHALPLARRKGEKGEGEEGREGKTSQISLRLYLDCTSDFFSNQQTVESLNVFAKYNNSNNTEERDSTALS